MYLLGSALLVVCLKAHHKKPHHRALGPLLFLLYINDVSFDKLNFYLFADDTNILYANKSLKSLEQIVNQELCNLYCFSQTLVRSPVCDTYLSFPRDFCCRIFLAFACLSFRRCRSGCRLSFPPHVYEDSVLGLLEDSIRMFSHGQKSRTTQRRMLGNTWQCGRHTL